MASPLKKRLPPLRQTPVDATCDFCGDAPEEIIDAPTNQGPWAHFCKDCFRAYGREGMGTRHPNLRARRSHA